MKYCPAGMRNLYALIEDVDFKGLYRITWVLY